ncbi:MAG: hypothetical protein H7319_20990 [Spirosoma sp.]|nr:hypothetical protein [Spirosoma sp.]
MNQTFSISRFGRVLYKYISNNRTQLLLNVALLTGILLIGTLLFYRSFPIQTDRNRMLSLFLFGWPLWYVFTWQQVEVLNNREQAMGYLLQPASQLEKFLAIWLVSGIGFLIMFFGLFTITDAVGVAYVNGRNWNPEELKVIRQAGGTLSIRPFYQSNHVVPPAQMLVLTALLHPFCLAAFMFINRYSFSVVGVLILVMLAVGYFINSYMLTWFLNTAEPLSTLPFERAIVESPKGMAVRKLDLPQPLGDIIRYTTGIAGIVLLYIIAFYSLKEREV